MSRTTRSLLTLSILAAAAGTAAADPAITGATEPSSPYTVGARVGGYGFRNPDPATSKAWNDCRMNGVGVFGRRDFGRLSVETGADIYFSDSFPLPAAQSSEGAEDRLSGLVTVAAGARIFELGRLTGLAQLGTGVELTRFQMQMDNGTVARATRALPMGFVGVGAEVRVGARTELGAQMRLHVMGRFDATPECTLTLRPDAAAQGQFYLTYRM